MNSAVFNSAVMPLTYNVSISVAVILLAANYDYFAGAILRWLFSFHQ